MPVFGYPTVRKYANSQKKVAKRHVNLNGYKNRELNRKQYKIATKIVLKHKYFILNVDYQ